MWKRWVLASGGLATVLLLLWPWKGSEVRAAHRRLDEARAAAVAAGMRLELDELLPRLNPQQEELLRRLTNCFTPFTPKVANAIDECVAALAQGPLVTAAMPAIQNPLEPPHFMALFAVASALHERISANCKHRETNAVRRDLAALTGLALDWSNEEGFRSQSVRGVLQGGAFVATQRAVQAGLLPDAELQNLKLRWLAADYRARLPLMAEVQAAEIHYIIKMSRHDGPQIHWESLRLALHVARTSPAGAWQRIVNEFRGWRSERNWAAAGSYRDEARLLDHFRERFAALQLAGREDSWSRACQHPAATNFVPPLNLEGGEQLGYLLELRAFEMQQPGGIRYVLGGEICRRVLVTALAAEQFRRAERRPPANLGELVPRYLDRIPNDYATGQPLRYIVVGAMQFNVSAEVLGEPEVPDTRLPALSWLPTEADGPPNN